jgi:DNA-binding CsgD family transcriptional regulator
MIAVWAACQGKVALAQGRLAAAEGAFREAASLLDERDSHHFSRYVLAELAGIFAVAGDVSAAREWMRRSDARRAGANLMLEPWAELGRAWVIAAGGELTLAARQATYAASLARASGQHAVEAGALYDAVRLGQPAGAPSRLKELAGVLDGTLVPALAAAAAAFGVLDGYRLDEAAAAFGALGLRLHAAEAAAAAGRAHRAQGRAALADAAHQRLAAFLRACPGTRTPLLRVSAAETAAALTRREREIALMASSGLPSGAIAAKLNLSVRTVSNHLGRAYAKLGVAGRRELAARLDVLPDAQ